MALKQALEGLSIGSKISSLLHWCFVESKLLEDQENKDEIEIHFLSKTVV